MLFLCVIARPWLPAVPEESDQGISNAHIPNIKNYSTVQVGVNFEINIDKQWRES